MQLPYHNFTSSGVFVYKTDRGVLEISKFWPFLRYLGQIKVKK